MIRVDGGVLLWGKAEGGSMAIIQNAHKKSAPGMMLEADIYAIYCAGAERFSMLGEAPYMS